MSKIEDTTERKIGVKTGTNSGTIRVHYRYASDSNSGLLDLSCDRGGDNTLRVAISPEQIKELSDALLAVRKRTQEPKRV